MKTTYKLSIRNTSTGESVGEGNPTSLDEDFEVIRVLLKPSMFGTGDFEIALKPERSPEEV